jgi:hypothetical protein
MWRFAYASVAGTGHVRRGQAVQDVSTCLLLPLADGTEVLVAGVSDGAGSATRGADGASTACASFVEAVAGDLAQDGPSAVECEAQWARFVADWLSGFQGQIQARAESEGQRPRDYACTFLGAVVTPERAALLQIGDGAIVLDAEDPAVYDAFVWPQRGEYANETFFATDPAAFERVASDVVSRRIEEIALLTDGLQSLVLDQQQQRPHAPFFRSMFRVIRGAPAGHAAELSGALAIFLASPSVHARTDDDVTLVLATRRPVPSPPGRGLGCGRK